MRWTKRERTTGEVVAVLVLVAGALSVNPGASAARVETGMTPAEVEAALGTAGRPDYAAESHRHAPRDLSDLWSPETIERERALRKGSSWKYYNYDIGSTVVAVAFHGPEGDERVSSVDAYRVFRLGGHLLPWLVGAVAAGLLAAEALRWRRRTATPTAVPELVGAAV
jgi:hypothetical protein